MTIASAFLLVAFLVVAVAAVVLGLRLIGVQRTVAREAERIAEQRWQEWRARDHNLLQEQHRAELARAQELAREHYEKEVARAQELAAQIAEGKIAVIQEQYRLAREQYEKDVARAQELAAQFVESKIAMIQEQYEKDVARAQELAAQVAQNQLSEWKACNEREIRQDAIERSKAVIVGKVTEHLTPYLPSFRFNPKDARFIGSPIDLVIFDGLDSGDVRRVVFIEVKTGTANLTTRERQIRDAIKSCRVEWHELRAANGPTEGKILPMPAPFACGSCGSADSVPGRHCGHCGAPRVAG